MPERKIAFLVNVLSLGGTAKATLHLAQACMYAGMEAQIVVIRREGEYLEIAEKAGIAIIDLQGESRNAFPVRALARYLTSHRPDALIAMGGFRNPLAILAQRIAHTPVKLVLTDHGAVSYDSLNPRNSFLRKSLILFIHRLLLPLYRFADAIVSVSHASARTLEQHAWLAENSVQVIANPVVTPELHQLAQTPPAHPWLVQKRQPVVLAVGRFHPVKGFATLLEAFALLRKTLPCRLILLGEGPEKAHLTTLAGQLGITDSVDFPGFTPNPYSYMHHADAFVLSSLREALPTVVIEAMACGCPIIATDCPGGIREILADGAYGTLVPPSAPEALAEAVQQVLNGHAPCSRQQSIARAEQFSQQESFAQYQRLLEQLWTPENVRKPHNPRL